MIFTLIYEYFMNESKVRMERVKSYLIIYLLFEYDEIVL